MSFVADSDNLIELATESRMLFPSILLLQLDYAIELAKPESSTLLYC